MSSFDVVVVGAGVQGLVAAKTFLEIDPPLKLLIIDDKRTLGGVWAEENLYPGLLANNILGTFEYTDYPMDQSFGVRAGEHIPSKVIYQYLCAYSRHFGLDRRLECQTRVYKVVKVNDGWRLSVCSDKGSTSISLVIDCRNLVIATGLNSKPYPLNIEGASSFTRPLISLADFPQFTAHVLDDPSIRSVTVCGGSKAAHDAVYYLAAHGHSVKWIIQKSGYGTTPMAPSHLRVGPFAFWTEKLLTTRPITWLVPCIWSHFDGFGITERLLQRTWLGKWIIPTTQSFLISWMHRCTGLSADPESRKLMPDQNLLWYGSGSAITNYPTDFYQFIRNGQVEVIKKDISCLASGNVIKFTDGWAVSTDALICGTGWDHIPCIEFFPESIHAKIGIPSRMYSAEQAAQWNVLDQKADSEILERLPILLEDRPDKPRQHKPSAEPPTPWRLWRGIALPDLEFRDIVFLGMMSCPQTCLRAEISALWAYAYMSDNLEEPVKLISTKPSRKIDSQDERLYDTAIFQRYGFWRTPYGHGAKYADAVLEGLPYFDMLLQDLGLKTWRKGWGWFGELFGGGYWQGDYKGLIEEWKERQRVRDTKEGLWIRM